MKKIFISISILLLIISAANFPKNFLALAQSPSPSQSPNQNLIQQQLNELKTSIASKVAQLNLVEKRGVIGKVTDISDTQITLNDANGNVQFVDVDELTKFSDPNSNISSFGISDITKGMTLGVLGIYNKQSQRILARDVTVLNLQQVLVGVVSSIDSKNFNFYIVDTSDTQTFIDVEVVTRTYSYSSSTDITPAGFSKITLGESVVVTGYPDKQNQGHIIATRVILFPDVPKNPKINIAPALNPDASIIPSTGSGRKLIPIVK